eukprot:10908902-Lingulodinium_polyedra.AAC.1
MHLSSTQSSSQAAPKQFLHKHHPSSTQAAAKQLLSSSQAAPKQHRSATKHVLHSTRAPENCCA